MVENNNRNGGGSRNATNMAGVDAGEAAGTVGGAIVGGVLGSVAGPVGAIAGAVAGGALGNGLGQSVGGANKLTKISALTNQVIATDFLMSAKTGVRSCAIAITESATPEVRSFLQGQLEHAVALHGDITELMMKRGWYHPYNASEQINLDIERAQTALNLG